MRASVPPRSASVASRIGFAGSAPSTLPVASHAPIASARNTVEHRVVPTFDHRSQPPASDSTRLRLYRSTRYGPTEELLTASSGCTRRADALNKLGRVVT